MKNVFRMSKRALAVCLAVMLLIGILPFGGLLASAETTELMSGGDFESGSFGGNWQSGNNEFVTSPVHGGGYAVKVDFDNNNSNMMQGFVHSLSSAKTYIFSFWYYVPAGESVQIQLLMQGVESYAALPGETGRYSVPVTTGSLAATDTWLQFTKEFTLAEGDTGMQFQIYSRQAGDIYYIDDVSLKEKETEKTYVDIDFDVETDIVAATGYNDNDDAKRTFLVIQTANTLPVADWGTYAGSATVTIDGASVPVKAAGMANANQLQLYVNGDTTNYTTASEITIPAGTEFTKDNTVVRFTKDFTIVNSGSGWAKKEEAIVPTDRTTAEYPEIPEDKTNLAVGGDLAGGLPSNWIATADLVTVADGMAKITGDSQLVTVINSGLVPGHTYTYSMYYWVSEISNNPQFLVQAYYEDANGEAGYSVKYSPVFTEVTEGWNQLTVEYTLSESASSPYRLSFQIQSLDKASTGDGTMYVDDITVYDQDEVPVVIVTPTDHGGDTELPENAVSAGVQNGDLSSTDGQNFVGATLESGMGLITAGGQYIQFNNVTVTAGVEYTLAFYVWVTEASADMDFDVFFTTSAASPSGTWTDFAITHANVTSNLSDGIKTTTDGWQRVTLKWTPAADGSAQFGLKNYGSASGCAIYIDDVSLTYEDTFEYIEIYGDMVDLFAAQAQADRTVFGIEIDGVNIPYDASWRNFGYSNVLVDGVSTSIPFGTTTTSTTWGMDDVENKILLYLPLSAYEASNVTIPAGTKLIHPADSTLGYEFAEDVVIEKSAVYGWPEQLLRGVEVALGAACRSDITIHVPSYYSEAGLQMQYTVNDTTATAALTAVENGLYTASIATSLKNIGDVYALQVIDADGNPVGLPVETYSVEDYAVSIANTSGVYSDAEVNAAVMLLNAGLKAQRYFSYNLDDEITEWVTFPEEAIEAIDAQIALLTGMTVPAGADNYVGSTLVLKDVTKIRMYFTNQVTGSELSTNGLYYLEISGIDAANLDTFYEVDVDGATYRISVLSLVKQILANDTSSAAFKELARAMFLYSAAAEDLVQQA